MSRTESGLLSALEEVLRSKGEPLDCHQLFELPSIRRYATTANRVSDYLGHMWRRGLLTRQPASRSERGAARWMYQWRTDAMATEGVAEEHDTAAARQVSRLLVRKPNIEIIEGAEGIVIDLPEWTITVKRR